MQVLTKEAASDAYGAILMAAKAAGTLEALALAQADATAAMEAAEESSVLAVFAEDPEGLKAYRAIAVAEAQGALRMSEANPAGDAVGQLVAKGEVVALSCQRLTMLKAAASWRPDPISIGDFRYWDGVRWTPYVSTCGIVHEEI
jgi:hypothetical protein